MIGAGFFCASIKPNVRYNHGAGSRERLTALKRRPRLIRAPRKEK